MKTQQNQNIEVNKIIRFVESGEQDAPVFIVAPNVNRIENYSVLDETLDSNDAEFRSSENILDEHMRRYPNVWDALSK